MTYCLDTNICIYHLNNPASAVSGRLKSLPAGDIVIPAMVVAELLYGAEKSVKREASLERLGIFLSPYAVIDFNL